MNLAAPLPMEDQTAPPGAGDVALAMLLQKSSADPDLAAEARAYLNKHGQMLDLQMENLHEQRIITLNHLKRQELSDRLKMALQILTILFGVAVAVFLAAAVWDASRSNSLVIQPISGPPDLAARGVTPTAVSAQLLDKLRAMQGRTDSARAANTYRSNWGDDIQIEIPQTGVSVGELFRLMRRWLGHDVYISGEAQRNGQGLALTTRVGDQPGKTFQSADDQLDGPMQQAAEAIYASTQPYRYSVYLSQNERADDAMKVLRELSESGGRNERAWALIGLGGQIGAGGDFRQATVHTRRGLALNPNLGAGWMVLGGMQQTLGRDEGAYNSAEHTISTLKRADSGGITKTAAAQAIVEARAIVAESKGAFTEAAGIRSASSKLDRYQDYVTAGSALEAMDRILAHEPIRPESVTLSTDDIEWPLYRARLLAAHAYATGEWTGLAAKLEQVETAAQTAPGVEWRAQAWPAQVWPWRAYAYARDGRMAAARALIARTPLDCYLCLRARAWIAALEGDAAGRDYWFSRAVKAAPSLPFADGEWGRAMAASGEHAAAEQCFRRARRLGPNWPEPLVWWSRSLAAQGRKSDAAMRVTAARKLAPQWQIGELPTPHRTAMRQRGRGRT